MRRTLVLFLFILGCNACSSRFATDGEHQYLSSKSGVKIVVPKQLSNENASNFYDLPDQEKKSLQVSIAPPINDKKHMT